MNNYCSNCGEPLAGANFCPNCGEPVANQNKVDYTEYREPSQHIQREYTNENQPAKKGSAAGTVLFAFLFIILWGILFSIVYINFGPDIKSSSVFESVPQKSESTESNNSEYITLDEYNSIESGMTYKEVVDIIGSSGTSMSESSSGNITMKIFTWYGNGIVGSNANVTFTNGKVTGKAQVGLK